MNCSVIHKMINFHELLFIFFYDKNLECLQLEMNTDFQRGIYFFYNFSARGYLFEIKTITAREFDIS